MNEASEILHDALSLGAEMLICGAEVNRVEDTITRILLAYGMSEISVFTITSNIDVTARAASGELLSQTRRILKYKTDFTRLEALNALSREICESVPEGAYLRKALESCSLSASYSKPTIYFSYALIASSFTIFFGGNARDAVAAVFVSLLLRFSLTLCGKLDLNYIITNFLCSGAGGLAAALLVRGGIGQNVDKILIGNIMLLIPGVALTNAIRDMISGDTMSGMLRLLEAVLVAIAMAVGFNLVLFFIGF